jgi:hypothetical protein
VLTDDERAAILAAIASVRWREAVTYRETAPHEYILWWDDPAVFTVVGDAIRAHGQRDTFHGHSYKYLHLDGHGWKYWRFRRVLNRARL